MKQLKISVDWKWYYDIIKWIKLWDRDTKKIIEFWDHIVIFNKHVFFLINMFGYIR